jgi:hypothetical protein
MPVDCPPDRAHCKESGERHNQHKRQHDQPLSPAKIFHEPIGDPEDILLPQAREKLERQKEQVKCFVASDHVESPLYRVFTPDEVFDIVMRHQLHFDQTRQTGVVFHMLSALG